MLNFIVDFYMHFLNELLGRIFRYRLIPDTRVKRFSKDEAVAFLKAHNRLFHLWDDSIWNAMQQRPDDDIFLAYEEVCYEHECAG